MGQDEMQLDWSQLVDLLRRFWRWWMAGLAALVPAALARRVRRLFAILEIETDGSRVQLRHRHGDMVRELGTVAFADRARDAVAAELGSLLAAADGYYDRSLLCVAPSRVLSRTVRVPAAARHSLAEAVGYDIDRQTPFGEDQVYFTVEPIPGAAGEGEILARLEVVRRSDIDEPLAILAAAGIRPDRIVAGDAGGRLPLPAAAARERKSRRRLAGILALGAAVAFFLAAYLPVARVNEDLARIEAESARTRAAAQRVESLRREMQALAEAESRLLERKAHEPMALTLLAEVTAAIPDSAFLIEFGADEVRVTFSGYAEKASDAISWIEGTEHLGGARFLSPVMQDQRLGRERFSLAAERRDGDGRVRQPEGGRGP
ncbi:MAG: PilN domain-containing protein [Rhodothalassiaceae bacterium]